MPRTRPFPSRRRRSEKAAPHGKARRTPAGAVAAGAGAAGDVLLVVPAVLLGVGVAWWIVASQAINDAGAGAIRSLPHAADGPAGPGAGGAGRPAGGDGHGRRGGGSGCREQWLRTRAGGRRAARRHHRRARGPPAGGNPPRGRLPGPGDRPGGGRAGSRRRVGAVRTPLEAGWPAAERLPGTSTPPAGSLFGLLVGVALIWGIRILGTLGFGKEAMGLGDVHILAAVGAVAGLEGRRADLLRRPVPGAGVGAVTAARRRPRAAEIALRPMAGRWRPWRVILFYDSDRRVSSPCGDTRRAPVALAPGNGWHDDRQDREMRVDQVPPGMEACWDALTGSPPVPWRSVWRSSRHAPRNETREEETPMTRVRMRPLGHRRWCP